VISFRTEILEYLWRSSVDFSFSEKFILFILWVYILIILNLQGLQISLASAKPLFKKLESPKTLPLKYLNPFEKT